MNPSRMSSTPPTAGPFIAEARRELAALRREAREAMPTGDFRDWEAIEDWANEIAGYLKGLAATSAVCG